jgi:hypothetical protein
LAVFWGALAIVACDSTQNSTVTKTNEGQGAPAASTAPVAPVAPAAVVGPRLEFFHAPDGDVVALVHAEIDRAHREGRKLLVYVGATWCEPCQRFHKTAESGALDARLPPMRFLEFDSDHDGERLETAGYRSHFIPLFALPNADGTPTGKQIEGSIKGPGAPDEITPRLLELVQQS